MKNITIVAVVLMLAWFLWAECSRPYEAKNPEIVYIEDLVEDIIPEEPSEAFRDNIEPHSEDEAELIPQSEVVSEKSKENIGIFKLTAYCSCSKCCGKWADQRPIDENGNEIVYGSTGKVLKAGTSIAVDPEVIPYGSEVVINNHTYKADDCGGAIKGNHIDVYFDSHQDALVFGVQYAEVFIGKGE